MTPTPWNGEPISAPGVYTRMPISRYHEQCCTGPSVSSSGLRTLEQKTPAHFYATWSGNPNAETPKTKALEFGKAAHALILGDDHFHQHFVVSEFDNFRTEAAQEWKAEQEAAGKTIITAADIDVIEQMVKALSSNSMVQNGLLSRGDAECSLFWQDEETGLWLKARPDILPVENWIVDYKTTVDASPWHNAKDVIDRGYYMQLALVAEGMAALGLIHPGTDLEYTLIFQEKTPPYSVVAQGIDRDLIWVGAQQNRRAIRKIAECLKSGDWPSYDAPHDIVAPDWFTKRMDAQVEADELPDPSATFEKIKEIAA